MTSGYNVPNIALKWKLVFYETESVVVWNTGFSNPAIFFSPRNASCKLLYLFPDHTLMCNVWL